MNHMIWYYHSFFLHWLGYYLATFSCSRITFRILRGTYINFLTDLSTKYFESFLSDTAILKASSLEKLSFTDIFPLVFPFIWTGNTTLMSFKYSVLAWNYEIKATWLKSGSSRLPNKMGVNTWGKDSYAKEVEWPRRSQSSSAIWGA